MINAAIIGLGWWGKTLVRAVQGRGEIKIVAGATGRRAMAEDFARDQNFDLLDSYDDVLAREDVSTIILATPHLDHERQMVAAAEAGKHIFVEKPFTLDKASAERAAAAIREAGVTIGLGHNRRFHPHMDMLRRRLANGDLGKVMHVEATMTAPNGLFLKPDSWRVDPRQSPAGGMAGLGIHMVDAIIDLMGTIRNVACQSLHLAVPTGAQDTTSILLHLANGATGYVSCMTATAPSYRFCIYGSRGIAEIRGQTLEHMVFTPTPDAPLSGHAKPKPPEVSEIGGVETVVLELQAFARAVRQEAPFPISIDQMVHGAAVFEAIATSAETGGGVEVPQ